jgi:hypothetical protein
MLKSLRCLVRCCQLERFLERRLSGLNPTTKTLAKHAYRTRFHRSRKLVAAVRASALSLCAHSPNRPLSESNTTLHKWCGNRPAQRLTYCSPVARAIREFRDNSPSSHVSEQNSCPWHPAASRVDNDLKLCGGLKLTTVRRFVRL